MKSEKERNISTYFVCTKTKFLSGDQVTQDYSQLVEYSQLEFEFGSLDPEADGISMYRLVSPCSVKKVENSTKIFEFIFIYIVNHNSNQKYLI